MTALRICSRCGGEYHSYENGDGTEYGSCPNCGASHAINWSDAEEERRLLENHRRGAPRIRGGNI